MLYVENRNGEKILVKTNHIGPLGRVEVLDCLGVLNRFKNKRGLVYWLIKCECGEVAKVSTRRLLLCKNGCPKCRCGNKTTACATSRERIVRKMYRKYKNREKVRGGDMNISLQQFAALVSKKCFYCGGLDKRVMKGEAFRLNGLDRVDSNQGYHIDNVVPCCVKCNTMKWSLTRAAFISHIKKISSFLSKKGI